MNSSMETVQVRLLRNVISYSVAITMETSCEPALQITVMVLFDRLMLASI